MNRENRENPDRELLEHGVQGRVSGLCSGTVSGWWVIVVVEVFFLVITVTLFASL